MRQAGAYSGLVCGGISRRTGPHSLPLARIKKIMKKSGDDVKMISGEAPIVFSKACELFIEELTRRSWNMAIQGKRRTLHKEDVASAVIATDIFDFLVTLVSNSGSSIVGATTVMEMETMESTLKQPPQKEVQERSVFVSSSSWIHHNPRSRKPHPLSKEKRFSSSA